MEIGFFFYKYVKKYYYFLFICFFFYKYPNNCFKRDVGKTTLKRRLMGLISKEENENAYKLVQSDKTEEEMTHGVQISSLKLKGISFSLWDFAGKIIINKTNKY